MGSRVGDGRLFLGLPVPVVASVLWLSALPWITYTAHAVRWNDEPYWTLWFSVVATWTTFPIFLCCLVGGRPSRPWALAAYHCLIGAAPWALLLGLLLADGRASAWAYQALALAWLATSALAIGTSWLALAWDRHITPLEFDGFAGRIWDVEPNGWLAACLLAWAVALPAALAAAVVTRSLLMATGMGALAAAASLLRKALCARPEWRVPRWFAIASLPAVMAAAIPATPNPPLIVLATAIGTLAFAAVTDHRDPLSGPEEAPIPSTA